MNISIFGGSQPKDGEQAYTDAYELGRLLAKSHHTVITGGYIGTMEAVSRGAHEANGHVIGITCIQIEAWRPVQPNRWVIEEHRCSTLQERLDKLISSCDLAMALPGGPGTLTEIALTWNLMIVRALPLKPLILIGDAWRSTFTAFYLHLNEYIPQSQRELIRFAPDIQSALTLIPVM